jgi:di/tricarboxylate transporter
MSFDQIAILALIGAILILFIWGRWRYDLIAFTALLAAVVIGLVEPMQAFAGFGHPAVVTVAAVLIISRALSNSGLIDLLAKGLDPAAERGQSQHIGFIGIVAALLSAFINNVGALALLMPVALKSAAKSGRTPGFILMPLAFASILGGTITLIGTPPNIIIANYRASTGGEAFSMFDFTPVGAVVALAGLLFIAFLGWRLIPAARRAKQADDSLFEIEAYVTELRVPEDSPLLGKGRRQIESEFEKHEVALVGLIREHQHIHSATWRGRISSADILVLEAAPEGIDKLVSTYGLEMVGSGAEVSDDLKFDEVALVEAVVSPAGMIENRTASGIRLRGRFGVNLLAVSRQGRPIKTRLHTMRLRAGDVLLLQGPVDQMPTILGDIGCLPLAERGVRIGRPERAWLSLAVFVAAIICMSLGLIAAPIALGLAAMAMLFLNVASLREAYDSINWPVIILLGAMIPIGGALESSGATDLITASILSVGDGLSPIVVMTILLIVTMTLSDIVNNAATAVIMAPIAYGLAERLQVNADAFLMAVAIGASCAFLTPIGHQNNTLVLGPGGYRFGDYWRMGLPLEILVTAVSIPMILWIWPLT